MKRIVLVLFLAVLAATFLSAARTGWISFGTLTAAGTSFPVDLAMAAQNHSVQVITAGTPATCSIQLEGTLDDPIPAGGAAWANLSGAQTCTSSTVFHVAGKPVRGVRVNLTALTGGTNPSVTVKYVGIE